MNVLGLFDGISCGQLALRKVDIPVSKYYASEIDKYALKVTDKRFPDTIQLGNVWMHKKWDIPWDRIDLVMGGFPCQSWSIAGNQQGPNDHRGQMVFDMLAIWNKIKTLNPKAFFLWENVCMKMEYRNQLSTLFGQQPIMINSALVSAQHRKRLYWTNIPIKALPEDKGILLSNIIEPLQNCKTKTYKVANLETSQYENTFLFLGRVNNRTGMRGLDGKSPTITKNSWEQNFKWILRIIKKHDYHEVITRKITPLEFERLQTLPDGYTNVSGISDTQRYKMIGNAWTVDVIAWILSHIKK